MRSILKFLGIESGSNSETLFNVDRHVDDYLKSQTTLRKQTRFEKERRRVDSEEGHVISKLWGYGLPRKITSEDEAEKYFTRVNSVSPDNSDIEEEEEEENLLQLFDVINDLHKDPFPLLKLFDYLAEERKKNKKYNPQKADVGEIDLSSVYAINAAPETVTNYKQHSSSSSSSSSTKDFRQTYADFFLKKFRIWCSKDNISLTSGGIINAIEKCITYNRAKYSLDNLEGGINDTMLITTPGFGEHLRIAKRIGINHDFVNTTKENGFLLDKKTLEATLESNKDRRFIYLILCNPNNPTGTLMTEKAAYEIADVVMKHNEKHHNLLVISDEAFLFNIVGDQSHFPLSSVPGMFEHCVAFTSIAKFMEEDRLIGQAICIGEKSRVQEIGDKLGGYPESIQESLAAAMDYNSEINIKYAEKCRLQYLENINVAKEKIQELNEEFRKIFGTERYSNHVFVKPFIENPQVGGPFLIDFSGLKEVLPALQCGENITEWLYKEAKIRTVPGECFFFDKNAEPLVRISLSDTPEKIRQAFHNITQVAHTITNTPNWINKPFVEKWQNELRELQELQDQNIKFSQKEIQKQRSSEQKISGQRSAEISNNNSKEPSPIIGRRDLSNKSSTKGVVPKIVIKPLLPHSQSTNSSSNSF